MDVCNFDLVSVSVDVLLSLYICVVFLVFPVKLCYHFLSIHLKWIFGWYTLYSDGLCVCFNIIDARDFAIWVFVVVFFLLWCAISLGFFALRSFAHLLRSTNGRISVSLVDMVCTNTHTSVLWHHWHRQCTMYSDTQRVICPQISKPKRKL